MASGPPTYAPGAPWVGSTRWQSADSYATRVSNLRVGYRSLVAGTTVFDDGAADRVSGAGGTDWFWVGINDSLPDRQAGEAVN